MVKAKLARTGGHYENATLEFGSEIMKAIQDFASTIIRENATIIQKGIATGNVNGAEGLIFTIGYFDLLHGGGYRWDYGVNRQPWLSKDVQTVIGSTFNGSNVVQWLEGALGIGINVTIPAGYPGAGTVVYLPPGSSDNYMEAVINGQVPRILPKLLSDQAYAAIMDRCGQLLNLTEFANLGTGIRTYVEAANEARGEPFLGRGEAEEARQSIATMATSADADTTLG